MRNITQAENASAEVTCGPTTPVGPGGPVFPWNPCTRRKDFSGITFFFKTPECEDTRCDPTHRLSSLSGVTWKALFASRPLQMHQLSCNLPILLNYTAKTEVNLSSLPSCDGKAMVHKCPNQSPISTPKMTRMFKEALGLL